MLLMSLSFAHIFRWTCRKNSRLEHCLFLTILSIELIQAYPRQIRIISALKLFSQPKLLWILMRHKNHSLRKMHVLNKCNRLTQNKSESPHVRHLSYKKKKRKEDNNKFKGILSVSLNSAPQHIYTLYTSRFSIIIDFDLTFFVSWLNHNIYALTTKRSPGYCDYIIRRMFSLFYYFIQLIQYWKCLSCLHHSSKWNVQVR